MTSRENRPVVLWLAVVCAMIFTMVVVGGITRLTRSGLSIVEWKPVTGVIPPLSGEAWQETFQKYQATPEYLKVNLGLSLSEFKSIFFWEYIHRLLGRLAGVVFLGPYLFFLIRKRLGKGLARRLLVGLALASLEGPMGWFMVKSGLVDAPHVSPYLLTAHLSLAFCVFAYLFWILLDLAVGTSREEAPWTSRLRAASLWLIGLVSLEVFYGGLTAGLKAGYVYNTFPKMNDDWIPPGLFSYHPLWLNFFENPAAVQFFHRIFAMALLLGVIGFRLYAGRFPLNRVQKIGVNLLTLLATLQASLGIYILVRVIPVGPAVLHQAVAFLLFGTALFVRHSFSRPRIRADFFVETRGIEPLTSCMPCRRSPS